MSEPNNSITGNLPPMRGKSRDAVRMDLFTQHGIAFIHIPKAGGSSFERMIYGEVPSNHQRAERFRDLDPTAFASMLKIALVRNPYQRVLSAYKYLAKGGNQSEGDKKKQATVLASGPRFKEFVTGSLQQHVKSSQKLIFFKSQLWYIAASDMSRMLVDVVIKLESAAPAIEALGQKDPRFANMTLPWLRSGGHQRSIENPFDSETADIIYELYRDEFEFFGYDRDSWTRSTESQIMGDRFGMEVVKRNKLGSIDGSGSRKLLSFRDCEASAVPSRDELIRYVADTKKLALQPYASLLGRDALATFHGEIATSMPIEGQSVTVSPGDDLQAAIDQLFGLGGGTVHLTEGTFTIERPVKLRSGVSLVGAGNGTYFADVVKAAKSNWAEVALGPVAEPGETLFVFSEGAYWPMFSNLSDEEITQTLNRNLDHGACIGSELMNALLSDFRIYGGVPYSEMNYPVFFHEDDHPLHNPLEKELYHSIDSRDLLGVFITANDKINCSGIHFSRLTISHTGMGIQVRGCNDTSVTDCVIAHNGNIAEHWHNLYFRRSSKVRVERNILANCRSGNGLNVHQVEDVFVDGNIIVDNHFRGLRINISTGECHIGSNLILGNGEIGCRLTGCRRVDLSSNFVRDNGLVYHPDDYIVGVTCRIQYLDCNCYID